jgi:hypothetical protein
MVADRGIRRPARPLSSTQSRRSRSDGLDLEDLLGRDCSERRHPDDPRSVPVESETSAPLPATQVRFACGDGVERSVLLTSVTIVSRPAARTAGAGGRRDAAARRVIVAVRMAALAASPRGIAHDFNTCCSSSAASRTLRRNLR